MKVLCKANFDTEKKQAIIHIGKLFEDDFLFLLKKANEKTNGILRCEFEVAYKRRSKNANACFHACCTQLANEIGEDMETIKAEVKKKAVSRGYPCKLDKDGGILISKVTGDPIPKPSHLADTKEFSMLFDVLDEIASFCGVILDKGAIK